MGMKNCNYPSLTFPARWFCDGARLGEARCYKSNQSLCEFLAFDEWSLTSRRQSGAIIRSKGYHMACPYRATGEIGGASLPRRTINALGVRLEFKTHYS